MTADGKDRDLMRPTSTKPAWAEVWHLWKVLTPLCSITGRLVYGLVRRRHDGRSWVYRKFAEYER
jgi:hypothetical protein